MLRQIVLVSLAMTACATLIPTNVKAATIITGPDSNEIISTTEIEPPVPNDPPKPDPTKPDPTKPEFETPDYIDPPKGHPDHPLNPENENSHIVPEPLTIFGTALGLGCGVLLKRNSSKKEKI